MHGSPVQSLTQDVAHHPRVLALSTCGKGLYLDLLHYASPDGFVVTKRIDDWKRNWSFCFYDHARDELIARDLLILDGEDQWRLVLPVTLDRAEAFERGEVP